MLQEHGFEDLKIVSGVIVSFFVWLLIHWMVRSIFMRKTTAWCRNLIRVLFLVESIGLGFIVCHGDIKPLDEVTLKILLTVDCSFFAYHSFMLMRDESTSFLLLGDHVVIFYVLFTQLVSEKMMQETVCFLALADLAGPLYYASWFLKDAHCRSTMVAECLLDTVYFLSFCACRMFLLNYYMFTLSGELRDIVAICGLVNTVSLLQAVCFLKTFCLDYFENG